MRWLSSIGSETVFLVNHHRAHFSWGAKNKGGLKKNKVGGVKNEGRLKKQGGVSKKQGAP